MKSSSQQKALDAASHFTASRADLNVCEIGSGNINDTFLVSCQDAAPFILQRLSSQAFESPELICENLQVLNNHLSNEHTIRHTAGRRWALPQLVNTQQGKLWWSDGTDIWRALTYIDHTTTLPCLQSTDQALEVGRALAIFHSLVRPIAPDALQVTIPHFHETPHYFKLYEDALATNHSWPANDLARQCNQFIKEHRDIISILEEARVNGELKTTTTHGDPKLANILFDKQTGQACSLIDLDTVGPGLLLADIGDCLRSCCNPGGATYDLESTRFDVNLCLAIMEGYLDKGRHLLDAGDKKYLLTAIRLIPFELGLRFFTDYLQGCHYFKTTGPEQTLQRAAAQFHLVASIEQQLESLSHRLDQLLKS